MAEFKNIDVKDISIFGMTKPKDRCWYNMLKLTNDFNALNLKEFEKSLHWNVEASYYQLVKVSIKDLDSDIDWFASFENGRKKWDLKISTSKDPDVSPD